MRPEELPNLSADDCVLLIQDSDPVLAQKVRYFEDRSWGPVFEGQKGEHHLPAALALSLVLQTEKPKQPEEKTLVPAPRQEPDGDEADDISVEAFQAMKSNHQELLGRIKQVKDKVNA